MFGHSVSRGKIIEMIPDCGLTLAQAEVVADAIHRNYLRGCDDCKSAILAEGAVWDASLQMYRDLKTVTEMAVEK